MIPESNIIDNFKGEYDFLSNFYPSQVDFKGVTFPTVEHAYQAAKSDQASVWVLISGLPAEDAGKAKKIGRKVKMRSDWEMVKIAIMRRLLSEKFKIPELREKLLATGDAELIEGNYWHDNTWGDCKCSKCSKIEGKNYLGKLLMKIRGEIK